MGAFVVGGRLWVGGGAEEEEIGGLWKCNEGGKGGVGQSDSGGDVLFFPGGEGVGTMVMSWGG
jgi:hypothetical protein